MKNMVIMKARFILTAIVLIIVLMLSACTPKSKTHYADEHEGGPGGDYEALPAGFGYPYSAILDGDLSEFAGTWVNNRGEKKHLRVDGTFNAGETAYEFTRGADRNSRYIANGTNYEWIISMGGDAGAFDVWLFPAGVDIRNYDGEIVQTDKTLDRIIAEIIRSSNEVYYRMLPQQIAHNAIFKNQTIPMTIFYHYDEDGGYYFTEKITFDYNSDNHTLDIPWDWYPYSSIGEDSTYNIEVNDFNFDGYMDIAIFNGSGTTTFWNNYFIYNPRGKRYEYHEKMSGLPNIFIDEETKTVTLHTNDGHAGMMYTSSEYKWINGELTLIRKDKQDYDSDKDIYVRTTGTLQNNRVWEEKKQQFTEAQLLEE